MTQLNGAVVHRDVTASETRAVQPGELVTDVVSEIERLTGLGFLQPIDDHSAKDRKVKPMRPQTGIDNDPRVRSDDACRSKDASGFCLCAVMHREDLHARHYQYAESYLSREGARRIAKAISRLLNC